MLLVKLKRKVQGKVPTISNVELGELASIPMMVEYSSKNLLPANQYKKFSQQMLIDLLGSINLNGA